MKTREQLITDMCYTRRHDYGIVKDAEYKNRNSEFIDSISSGMYQWEREHLWKQMEQLFDNNIAPYMEFKHIATSKNICGND